jgi:hypothetical protein
MENLNGRDRLGDLGVDGRTISKWIIEICGGCNWTHVFQDVASNEMEKTVSYL